MYDTTRDWALEDDGYKPDHSLGSGRGYGAIGRVRNTWIGLLLFVLTLGLYSIYWSIRTHHEMRRHSGVGIGGAVAGLLAIFIWPVLPFLSSSEVGGLYRRAQQDPPVSGYTGLWSTPGFLLLVLPIVWYARTNNALNEYWQGLGAT
jgi:Domain of unknown function (DUF4234)